MRALIERIKQNIPEYRAYDEAATRNSIILPILNKLGWDIFSRDSVYPEYPVGSKRVDYSLRILEQNRFFIETKRCNVDLACHQEQLLGYAFHFGVELACLTNGITWQFFCRSNPVNGSSACSIRWILKTRARTRAKSSSWISCVVRPWKTGQLSQRLKTFCQKEQTCCH